MNPSKKVTKIRNLSALGCEGYRAAGSVLRQTGKKGIEFGDFLYKTAMVATPYSNPAAGAPISIPTLFSSPQALAGGGKSGQRTQIPFGESLCSRLQSKSHHHLPLGRAHKPRLSLRPGHNHRL